MNLKQCPNKHFYDASKFAQCPHCSTTNQDVTVAVNPQSDLETVTVAATSQADLATDRIPSAPQSSTPKMDSLDQDAVGTIPLPKDSVQIPNISAPVPPSPVFVSAPQSNIPQPPVNDDDDKTVTISMFNSKISEKKDSNIAPVVGWLVATTGETKGKSYQLKSGRNFIGRSNNNDIVLPDSAISREKHAILVFEPRAQQFMLQPGTSSELFYLNGDVVLTTTPIEAYDVLNLGETNLVFIPFCSDKFNWKDTIEE